MFEIKVTRYHDGRYVASVPGFHKQAIAVEYTLEKAVRTAQMVVLNVAADALLHNRALPVEMRQWFHVQSDDGKTHVGGSQLHEHAQSALIHSRDNVIPAESPGGRKPLPNLPQDGTPEFIEFMARLAPGS